MSVLLLCLGFFLPIGSLGLDMIRDNATCQAERDIRRIRAAWQEAESRTKLLPEDFFSTWPERLTPSDLPGRLGLVVGSDTGRHHIGNAIGTATQRALWNSPTGQFWAIVENLTDLTEPCAHCTTPEEHERAHVGCPGCACPCTLVAMEMAR